MIDRRKLCSAMKTDVLFGVFSENIGRGRSLCGAGPGGRRRKSAVAADVVVIGHGTGTRWATTAASPQLTWCKTVPVPIVAGRQPARVQRPARSSDAVPKRMTRP